MALLHEATLAVAYSLLNEKRDAYSRRAVSSAYYALFQRFCAIVAASLSRAESGEVEYRRAYRLLDHRHCRDMLNRSPEFKLDLGVPFAELQDIRQWADYSVASHPNEQLAKSGEPFSHAEAEEFCRKALQATTLIDSFDPAKQIRLMVTLVVRDRT